MRNVNIPDGYISCTDAAKRSGLARNTIYLHCKNATLPCTVVRQGPNGGYRVRLIKEEDFQEFMARRQRLDVDTMIDKRRKHKYEIVIISMGEVTTLYKTDSLQELSHMYIKMMERDHKLIRVRKDGKILTIHESDALGNTYHPRTRSKKGATA